VTQPVLAVVGPTAVGKSSVAVEVASRLEAEIVSVDSMQVYRGLEAGTAKPSADDRARVPHHLIDVYEPGDELTVAEFRSRARAVIEDIRGRGRLPLLVGGSGLYFRAVVDDLRFPPRSPAVRSQLEAEITDRGHGALHRRLGELDPAAAARVAPTNVRRIVRALEAIALTGRPFSDDYSWTRYESIYDLRPVGLMLPRDALYERIAARVDEMLTRGLVGEALKLGATRLGATARQALGYKQVLDAPSASDEVLRSAIVAATKRFARRQHSWFRADPRIVWVDARRQDLLDTVVSSFEMSSTPAEPCSVGP